MQFHVPDTESRSKGALLWGAKRSYGLNRGPTARSPFAEKTWFRGGGSSTRRVDRAKKFHQAGSEDSLTTTTRQQEIRQAEHIILSTRLIKTRLLRERMSNSLFCHRQLRCSVSACVEAGKGGGVWDVHQRVSSDGTHPPPTSTPPFRCWTQNIKGKESPKMKMKTTKREGGGIEERKKKE